jgi:RNA polymerase sigma-70 factor (sigma-E family)
MPGAHDAQEQFCASAWPRLVAAMSHYCGDVHLAEEFVQEALVRACRRWSAVSRLDSPTAWTYRVAVNVANSAWRRRRTERLALAQHGVEEDVQKPVAVDEQLRVRSALAALTAPQRDAVVMRYVLDLSVEETAGLLGSSPGAVRALTHRAVARLRDDLSVTTSEESPSAQ